MTNNTLLYLDSLDAKSMGQDVSKDYAFFFLANLSGALQGDLMQSSEDAKDWQNSMAKLISQSDSVGFFITDILYYRFLLSITMLFSISGQLEVSALLMSSAEKVFDTMERDEVRRLLDGPSVVGVETVLKDIVSTAIAENEALAILLSVKSREIILGLYSGDVEKQLSSFAKSARLVVPFSLHMSKAKINDIVKGGDVISVVDEGSVIRSEFPNAVLHKVDTLIFQSVFTFCDAICTVFSSIFVDKLENDELDEVYRRIWTFILKTKSSCFVPQKVYDKAREVLL